MILDKIHRPARRFLIDRLERLHQALEALGVRLRESIAEILGKQIGEAVRDGVERVLGVDLTRRLPERPLPRNQANHNLYGYSQNERSVYGYPQEVEEDGWYGSVPSEPETEPEPEPEHKPSRWKALLAGLAELATWWLHTKPKRPSLRKLLGIGAAVGAVTLFAGPLAGSVVMTIGTVALMTRMTDGATKAVEQLATMPIN